MSPPLRPLQIITVSMFNAVWHLKSTKAMSCFSKEHLSCYRSGRSYSRVCPDCDVLTYGRTSTIDIGGNHPNQHMGTVVFSLKKISVCIVRQASSVHNTNEGC